MIKVDGFHERVESLPAAPRATLTNLYYENIKRINKPNKIYMEAVLCETIRPCGTLAGVS